MESYQNNRLLDIRLYGNCVPVCSGSHFHEHGGLLVVCFQNCKFENYHGDCTVKSYGPNWICPPDREECFLCGEIFHSDEVNEEGLCFDCAADITAKVKSTPFHLNV